MLRVLKPGGLLALVPAMPIRTMIYMSSWSHGALNGRGLRNRSMA